jgi:hypothetical protein
MQTELVTSTSLLGPRIVPADWDLSALTGLAVPASELASSQRGVPQSVLSGTRGAASTSSTVQYFNGTVSLVLSLAAKWGNPYRELPSYSRPPPPPPPPLPSLPELSQLRRSLHLTQFGAYLDTYLSPPLSGNLATLIISNDWATPVHVWDAAGRSGVRVSLSLAVPEGTKVS